jgi:hypothetical protein
MKSGGFSDSQGSPLPSITYTNNNALSILNSPQEIRDSHCNSSISPPPGSNSNNPSILIQGEMYPVF